jgi:APA family basic amino acid/polyamine antiporter
VVGAIVGVGIFFTPSRVAALAGSGELALWTWVAGGAVAMLGALTLAELGGMYPKTGGQYDILRDAYGPGVGFTYVFCNCTAVQTGAIAIIALVCVQNAAVSWLGHSIDAGPTAVLAGILIVALAAANAVGVRWGARIQNVTVYAKMLVLLAVVAAAAFLVVPETPTAVALTSAPSTEGNVLAIVFAALVPALFSFGGWQQALWMGGEVRRPERNVPLAIIVGVAIVVVVYVATNWAYLRLLGHDGVASSQALAADAAAVIYGDAGRRGIAAAVAVSALGVLNAQLLTGPRLVLALARDGRFFAPFARVHAGRGTPIPAIGLMAAVALALLFAAGQDGIDRLLTGVVFVDGVFFALTGLAPLLLGRLKPRSQRPIRAPGYPVVPLVFVAAEIGIVIGAYMDPDVRDAALIGAAWIAGALALYVLRFRNRDSIAASERDSR